MDEQKNEYTPDLYELMDEDGNKQTFELLDCMDFEGERYYALTPFYEEDNADKILDEASLLVILKAEYDNETGEEILASIEDEDLFDRVGAAFEERLDEMFDFEDDEEEGE
ncbi:DUF1292 domain-containing protein [Ruminococcus albus]|jgi:uncharacterized protein YrzB (UPF0473 family)|uniref:DUF1292 domain-containing protein n=1 Tax=Ruminococcus albus SY3 TaxID=1341156 RepID=A0A011VVQ6_RUMAL|nr:DUF1292 domain-containing protein [Ruminococcus albus]EXM39351.1 hypothetical protein RASY3_05270 [Ruminococcus albus SY3]MBE6868415.1 DUF1292 domain-containing protein [Ruminococcus albus]